MTIRIQSAKIWQEGNKWQHSASVLIKDGKITDIGEAVGPADEVVDATGLTLLPGLIDVHTHGCIGYDFNTATAEQMNLMKADYACHGVTTVFPTLASASPEAWKKSIRSVQACGFDGIHLEGRYLNPEKRGAHAPSLLAPPDAAELENVLCGVSIPVHITAALELDKDGSFCDCANRLGATVALGHTMATAEEANAAMKNGATAFTHLFNCMPPLHHRAGGAVCTALLSDGFVELIADGLHVSKEMLALTYHCKQKDRIVLITDSMEATGCPDGIYSIAGQKVIVKNGCARTEDGALAGSTLRLWDGVKNIMQFLSIPLETAIAFATINPAKMVKIDHLVGSIAVGKRADLLLVDKNLQICKVFSAGKIIEV